MVPSFMGEIKAPDSSRQIAFHQLLAAARKTWLREALSEALSKVEPAVLRKELSQYVPRNAAQILAAAGIRDEFVFPVPVVLKAMPTLVGYYRLLMGIPKKTFYASPSGMALFQSMEISGIIRERQERALPDFCRAMAISLAELVVQISPAITMQDVEELPLLTLGQQFQGSNNNRIGQEATRDVFLAIVEALGDAVESRTDKMAIVRNASGRRVFITLAADPDVRVEEEMTGEGRRKKLALEIKGGTDRSNAHNRAGEAEKSHQKAKNEGFVDFWTLIALHGLSTARLKEESRTTTKWYDVAHVLARAGNDWDQFREDLAHAVGIPFTLDSSS
ncbi:MAG TPA: XcyI family restriction endonuclease [Thermoanaerobaculia bacterium]|nr:XcyI family restriction endonuclease [Thermoanaerobaculia bacterium]